jgi:metal-sulfur cluster biosynthetic enzyme
MSALPVIGAGSHVSGGRDRWSAPGTHPPADVSAGVWDALREVLDPELPVSVVDLGLVYGLEVEGPPDQTAVTLRLTYTATACPCQEFIREDIEDRLLAEPWIRSVEIDEVWDPPWTSERISPAGQAVLRGFGVVT